MGVNLDTHLRWGFRCRSWCFRLRQGYDGQNGGRDDPPSRGRYGGQDGGQVGGTRRGWLSLRSVGSAQSPELRPSGVDKTQRLLGATPAPRNCETNPIYLHGKTAGIHQRCNGLCLKKLSLEIGFVWRENGRTRSGRPRHQGRNAERNMPYYQTNPPFYVGVFDAMVSMQGICEEMLRRIRWVRFRKTNPPAGCFWGET
jgi:hypothetical protein